MASLYPRGNQIWIKYRGIDGRPKRKSLNLQTTNPKHVQRAEQILQHRKLEEQIHRSCDPKFDFDMLASKVLERHKPKTRGIYQHRWTSLRCYLRDRKITHPAELKHADCLDYIPWRKRDHPEYGLKARCHNSAREDLYFLGQVMTEAVHREVCLHNPCRNLRIQREATAKVPEILDEHFPIIERALTNAPAWATTQFLIGRHTGCRISETWFNLSNVNFIDETLTMENAKKEREPFTIPLPPVLATHLKQLVASGQSHTFELHKSKFPVGYYSLWWAYFFRKKLQLPYTFRSFRVTFITRGRRAGIDRHTMMKLVHHSSKIVHEIYNRYDVTKDLRAAMDKLSQT